MCVSVCLEWGDIEPLQSKRNHTHIYTHTQRNTLFLLAWEIQLFTSLNYYYSHVTEGGMANRLVHEYASTHFKAGTYLL